MSCAKNLGKTDLFLETQILSLKIEDLKKVGKDFGY